MVGRKGDYLFRKPGSDVWRVRLQYPAATGKPEIRRSLGTTDRAVAEIMAMPMIQAHKLETIRATQRVTIEALLQEFPIFRKLEDIVAEDAAALAPARIVEPVESAPSPGVKVTPLQSAPPVAKPRPTIHDLVKRAKPVPMSNDDERMLDAFLNLKTRNRYYEGEARNEWNAFRAFVGGRAMKDCTRQDGRAYAEHLFAKGLKTATIVKRINYLAAPLNHDATFTDNRPNPFDRAIVEREDDSKEILPFTDEDMDLLNLEMAPNLKPNERTLWLICATTGMRHSEAFSIDREHRLGDIRYVKVGTKTKSSKRDVPLPDCLLQHPEFHRSIHKPLFTDTCKNVSKNLLRALRRAGVTDPQKNVYSLRHRAHARLRRMRCPEDLQRLIVGHTLEHKVVRKDDHYAYGKDCLVDLTKPWVDKIGY